MGHDRTPRSQLRRVRLGANPPVGADIYYHLKAEAKSVKLLVKDLEGNQLREIRGKGKPGLHRAFWNLQKQAPRQEGQRRRRAETAAPGLYKVVLVVDDKEVATGDLKIEQDPILLHQESRSN